jgi:flagellar hook-basal body complex protein FliE
VIPAISGAIGPLGPSEWSVGGIGSLGQGAATGTGAAQSVTGGSFNDTLTGAINSLDQTQVNASTASEQLATGQSTDPTQAITAVENASLSMDLASQIRTKLTDAVNEVFETQV